MNATRRAELLQGRIAPLDMELTRLRGEMNAAPAESASRQRYKDRAKRVLRQKKALEKRLEQALNQQFNMALIEDAAEAQEALRNDAQMYASMRASLGMPATDATSSLTEAMDENDELQQILSEPLHAFSEGMDDETLEAELQAELGLPAETAQQPTADSFDLASLSPDAQRVADVPKYDGTPGPLAQPQDAGERQRNGPYRPQPQDPRNRRY